MACILVRTKRQNGATSAYPRALPGDKVNSKPPCASAAGTRAVGQELLPILAAGCACWSSHGSCGSLQKTWALVDAVSTCSAAGLVAINHVTRRCKSGGHQRSGDKPGTVPARLLASAECPIQAVSRGTWVCRAVLHHEAAIRGRCGQVSSVVAHQSTNRQTCTR